MNNPKIDVEESLKKNRIVFIQSTLEGIEAFLVDLAIILLFPVMGISFLYFETQKFFSDYLIQSTIFFLLSTIYGVLITYSVVNNTNLKRIEGKNINVNRAVIKEIANTNEWKIVTDKRQFSILSPKWSLLSSHWGRLVFIIYDKNDVLFNSIAYGSHDLKSPFHWFANRSYENRIIQEFYDLLKKKA